jgi:2'-5' RNA ligase
VTRQAVRAAGGRPVPHANFHITLAFLGSVPADRVEDLVAAAAGLRAPAVPLILDRYGHFPKARVFWLGPTATPPEYRALVARLWEAVAGLGLSLPADAAVGGAGWKPHLTLCRKVQRQPAVPPPNPVSWTPTDFVLAESVTGEGGARYVVLARFPPAPPAAGKGC